MHFEKGKFGFYNSHLDFLRYVYIERLRAKERGRKERESDR